MEIQYAEYIQANSPLRDPNGLAQTQTAIEMAKKQPWKWWTVFGAQYYPDLAYVAQHVLSKQVGIGAVERSHKKMKKGVFATNRPHLSAAKANAECYINCNVPELDRLDSEEPEWLEAYGDGDEVVLDSVTVLPTATEGACATSE